MLCSARRQSHGTTILVHPHLAGAGAAGGPARRLRARRGLVLLARRAALGAAPGAACPAGRAPAAAPAAGRAPAPPRHARATRAAARTAHGAPAWWPALMPTRADALRRGPRVTGARASGRGRGAF